MDANEPEAFIWPKGWLLLYSVAWILVAVGIGYEAYKDFSSTVLASAVGFALVGVLLFARSKWAIPANILFSTFLICVGILAWYSAGRPGYLLGGVLCFGSTWTFREELRKQR